VRYDRDGTATVTIKDKNKGTQQTVTLTGARGGKTLTPA
jgi:hypothetical protein